MALQESTTSTEKENYGRRPTDVAWLHRLFDWGACRCPHFVEPFLRFGWVSLFFLLAKSQRRAVAANLEALFAGSRKKQRRKVWTLWAVFRVFWSFAGSLVLGARLRQGEDFVWEVTGKKHFDALCKEQGGVLMVTAHMGSYDAAAGTFARRFGRPLALVRQGEPDEEVHKIRQQQVLQDTKQDVHVFYNQGAESQLGMELLQALEQESAVAIQADRAMSELAFVEVEDGQLAVKMPSGPWELAALSQASLYPLFCFQTGVDCYRIWVGEPWRIEKSARKFRKEKIAEVQKQWLQVLLQRVRQNWQQWYVFEPSVRLLQEEDSADVRTKYSSGLGGDFVENLGEESVCERVGMASDWRCIWWERGALGLLVFALLGLGSWFFSGWWWICFAGVAWGFVFCWTIVGCVLLETLCFRRRAQEKEGGQNLEQERQQGELRRLLGVRFYLGIFVLLSCGGGSGFLLWMKAVQGGFFVGAEWVAVGLGGVVFLWSVLGICLRQRFLLRLKSTREKNLGTEI